MDYMVHQPMYFAAVGLSLFVIAFGLWLVWKIATPPPDLSKLTEKQRRQLAQAIAAQQDEDSGEEREEVVARPAPNAALNRMRRRNVAELEQHLDNAVNNPVNEPPAEQESVEDEQEEEDDGTGLGGDTKAIDYSNIGVKKLRKLQEKEERARIREATEAARKKRREDEALEIEQKKQERLAEIEKKKEEERELERLREERKKKEQEEYDAMKGAFSVEGEGEGDKDLLSQESSIVEFIAHLKTMKVVFLEDLAAKYNVKPQTIVDKIAELEKEGRLTGIIDERGKFIYISKEEMTNIAKFIKQRGRVTLGEIARESNRLIDLKPQKVAELKEVNESELASK